MCCNPLDLCKVRGVVWRMPSEGNSCAEYGPWCGVVVQS